MCIRDRLVTKVPKGATTGKVTVEVGGKTASSSVDFTVSAATTPAAFSTDNISSDITAETAKVSSTLTAVSYTHLDVYKRQVHLQIFKINFC